MWIPVETVMWVFIPPHLRVAFLCSISLLWQVALSTISNRDSEAAESAAAHAAHRALDVDDDFRRHSFPVMADQ